MFLELSLLSFDFFFEQIILLDDHCIVLVLLLNLAFVFFLDNTHLSVLVSELLFKCLQFFLHGLFFVLNLVNMSFDCRSLLVNYSFSLFDFIHVVLHLVIEIIFEEF